MIGAIIGDIAGSRFEFNPTNDYHFELFGPGSDFTDDTICTVAVADAILRNEDYGVCIHRWCRAYPHPKGSYGGSFSRWVASEDPVPYCSFGNGSAMRVSPVAWAFSTRYAVLENAAATAACTHNHPEGVKGAQTTALAIYLALQSRRKGELIEVDKILESCVDFSGYNINIKDETVRNRFDETCQGTLPVALWIIGQSIGFEDAVRRAVSLGADADTLGAIVGSIAEAIWGVPDEMANATVCYLPPAMRDVLARFNAKY